MLSIRNPLAVAVAAALLGGCAHLPSRSDVRLDTPQAWDATVPQADAAATTAIWPDAQWWQGFGSAELDSLMAMARTQNLDLAAAAARVLQAQGQARVAGAALLPTLGASVGAGRSGTINGGDSTGSMNASLSASYELDFWGANRASQLAARASLRASQYDEQTVALTLTTGVASTYLQVLTTRERLQLANDNLVLAERILKIAEARVRAGAATRLDVAQQRGVVASQRSAIPPLEQQEREARAALAILLARLPQGFEVQGADLNAIQVPPVTPGLPSELMMRRPDVRRAEAQLSAADANLAAARAAMFPSITLTGSTGAQNGSLGALFDNNPAYTLGVALTRPIFDAGRLSAQRDISAAARQEAIASYKSAVLAAFSDADVALAAIGSIERQQEQQAVQLEQARIAFEVAEARYRAGADDLLNVLDAQRTLYSALDQSVQLKLSRLQAGITLYRALGGGWQDGSK